MLENISNLVREEAGSAIINNPAIPNQHNEAVIQETSNSIVGSLKNSLYSDGINGLLGMFGNNGADIHTNPVTQNASGNVIKMLMEKFGINQGVASGVAGALVPTILKKLVNRTNDPADNSFNIQDIFNQLSGGKTAQFNLPSLIGKAKGALDIDQDGDTDLQDLKSMFSGNQEGPANAGAFDSLKGLFNK